MKFLIGLLHCGSISSPVTVLRSSAVIIAFGTTPALALIFWPGLVSLLFTSMQNVRGKRQA